jgi:hypothetical protein
LTVFVDNSTATPSGLTPTLERTYIVFSDDLVQKGSAMARRPRPLLAVRLIGSADVVTAYKEHLQAHFADAYGERATCRASTHTAGYIGETRVYLTVTATEVPPR